MADKSKIHPDNLLGSVWGKRASGLDIDIDWTRPVTPQELEYVLKQFPYLQILSTDPLFGPSEPKFIKVSTNWVVHDYGSAMSASPGEMLYGGYMEAEKDEEQGKGGHALNPGQGTITKQAVVTAAEMVDIAIEKNWPGIEIISGHEIMKWAAWNQALNHNIVVNGYEPDEEAEKRRERVKRLQQAVPTVTPQPKR